MIILRWTMIISVIGMLCGCVNTPIQGFADYSIFQGEIQ